MPSGRRELWDKFTKKNAEGNIIDDGIETCENLIRQAGGKVREGVIWMPDNPPPPVDVLHAMEYLCDEWDYSF